MKEKPIRLCVECGKQHDTGVENKITGDFNRIDECIDCLMGKCSFNFESKQITLDDVNHMTCDEMQFELVKTVCNILQEKYGYTSPIGFSNATMCDADGNAMEIKCKCGNEASSVIMGKESYMGLCNKCQYGE